MTKSKTTMIRREEKEEEEEKKGEEIDGSEGTNTNTDTDKNDDDNDYNDDGGDDGDGGYSCQPNVGKTYLTIGQDLFSIQNYILEQYNASLHRGSTLPMSYFQPAAAMVYTDIQTLRGLEQPIDYGSGIEYATGLVETLDTIKKKKKKKTEQQQSQQQQFGLQIGLWLNGTQGCRDIVSGSLNENIDHLLQYLVQEIPDTTKIFLRVGYEFDNPYFGYSDDPNMYREAYQMLVHRCEDQYGIQICRQKIAFCWHSWGAPRYITNLMDFYPGSYYVDWIGISIFQQLYPWAHKNNNDIDGNGNGNENGNDFAGGTMIQVREVLDLAKSLQKPILIAESTPFGGMYLMDQDPMLLSQYNLTTTASPAPTPTTMMTTPNNIDNDNTTTTTTSNDNIDIWKLWFQPTLDIIEEYDIGMWSYIDCNWNAQPMWKGIGFGDTRLVTSKHVMKQWWEQVLSNPRFVNTLECHDKNRNDKEDKRSTSSGIDHDDSNNNVPITTHKKWHSHYHRRNHHDSPPEYLLLSSIRNSNEDSRTDNHYLGGGGGVNYDGRFNSGLMISTIVVLMGATLLVSWRKSTTTRRGVERPSLQDVDYPRYQNDERNENVNSITDDLKQHPVVETMEATTRNTTTYGAMQTT